MDAFLDFLRFIYIFGLLTIVVVVTVMCLLVASIKTLHYTKQNNVLLKELCVKNCLNVDSLINTTQNDTLNLKIAIKGE